MLNCREVADILPAEDWSFSQKLQLKGHLLICSKCRALRRQYEAIGLALRKLSLQTSPMPQKISEEIISQWLAVPPKDP